MKPHGLDVVSLGLAAREATVVGKLLEQATERGLIRTGLAPLMIGIARGL